MDCVCQNIFATKVLQWQYTKTTIRKKVKISNWVGYEGKIDNFSQIKVEVETYNERNLKIIEIKSKLERI